MDASLLRMVTRELDVLKLKFLAANDRAFIDKSRPIFEADGRCKTPLDLFSGNSEVLLRINRYQPLLTNTPSPKNAYEQRMRPSTR